MADQHPSQTSPTDGRNPSIVRTALALARSCHPGPTAAVTVFAVLLFLTAGASTRTTLVGAVAVLAGQLSIGWSNDVLDADRDASVGRADKPVAAGDVPRVVAVRAIAVALLVTTVASLALGWRPGLVHLAAVGCGWAYNLGVKATVWSWLPYALAFGALPAVATLSLHSPRLPGVWAVVAGACLGVAAHLANVLPDLAADDATGVRGLPHVLGARRALVLAVLLLVGAGLCVLFGPNGPVTIAGWVGAGAVVVAVGTGGPLLWGDPGRRAGFVGIVAVVAIELVLLALTGKGLY